MSSLEPVSTKIGLAAGQVIIEFDREIDTVAYSLEAAREVADKIIELIEIANKDVTSP